MKSISKSINFITAFIILLTSNFSIYTQIEIPVNNKEKKLFRIGFIQSDMEKGLGLGWYNEVKTSLEKDKEIKKILNELDYEDIIILPSDSYRDMVQRMSHNEFDLVFCTAEIYVEQDGDYEPILQQRRKRDIWGRGQVFQKGEIWVNNKCPLFNKNNLTRDEIKKYIESENMAFVSSQSAPGYIYPRLKLYRDFGIIQPAKFIFCNSSEEVVKYLVNDLVRIGACENGVVEEIFKINGIEKEQDKVVKKIFETELLPTDPICVSKKISPENSQLGRVLASSLKKIYSSSEKNVPKLEASYSGLYKNLREEIEIFSSLKIEKKIK